MPETNKKDMNQAMQFDAIQIGLASPEVTYVFHDLMKAFFPVRGDVTTVY